VGPRAILDAIVKRKIPSPHQELSPRTPLVKGEVDDTLWRKGHPARF